MKWGDDDAKWIGEKVRLDRPAQQRFFCKKHGDQGSTVGVALNWEFPDLMVSRNYCKFCVLELLDNNLSQLEVIKPNEEDGS